MTEGEYWTLFLVIRNEVTDAMQSFYTYKEIENFAHENDEALQEMNRTPEFWITNIRALQTTYMIMLGRVFDLEPRGKSIQKLLAATVAHPEYFSKEALGRRKRLAWGNEEPLWLPDYLAEAWEPDTASLKKIKAALKPVCVKYDVVYRPIRHKVYAHKEVTDSDGVSDLFSKTLIADIEEILHVLHDVLECMWQLWENGARPQLGARQYDYQERIRKTTRDALIRLVGTRIVSSPGIPQQPVS